MFGYSGIVKLSGRGLTRRYRSVHMDDSESGAKRFDGAAASQDNSGARPAEIALRALRDRLARIHDSCSGIGPKQAVGELIAATKAMPEWDLILSALRQSDVDGRNPSPPIANGTVTGGDAYRNQVFVSMDATPSSDLWTIGARAYLCAVNKPSNPD